MKVDYGNSPECLNDLSTGQQAVLINWIRDVLVPAERVYKSNSYGMKHDFERELEGFYVTNRMFKGAMLNAGFAPGETTGSELAIPCEAGVGTVRGRGDGWGSAAASV